MKEWLQRFFQDITDEVTLTLNGATIKRSDCLLLCYGYEKRVYKIKDQNLCFFIPHKWSSEEEWNELIRKEKSLLDEIHELGLKTQRFEITSLDIHKPGETSCSILVLIAKDFESLCQEEVIAIYNAKGHIRKNVNTQVIGNTPNFFNQREMFNTPSFVQKMFSKIINEYAIALTFNLPIPILYCVDDSVHYCFELSNDPQEASVARFMFWDVVSDSQKVELPCVPNLKLLKAGLENKKGTWGLHFLANQIACAMNSMSIDISTDEQIAANRDFVPVTQKNMTRALDDDKFLNQALVHARKVSASFLNRVLNSLLEKDKPINFVLLMKSAISTSDLNLVEQFFQTSIAKALPNKSISTLLEFARQYENQPIITYLEKEKGLEVAARLAPIDNALAELEKKTNDRNQFHSEQAYNETKKLLQALKLSRETYKEKLENSDFNVEMETNFKRSCVKAIAAVEPFLEKDLDWVSYIKNLPALFFNMILEKAGGKPRFFELTESQSLKSVKHAAETLQLNEGYYLCFR